MTVGRRILPAGERALLVEVGRLDEALALHAALAASVPPGVDELVPAARTVLVRFDPRRVAASSVWAWIDAADPEAAPTTSWREVTVEIVYDGPDLAETAALLGVGAGELAERHARTDWRVAFTGFAPGFAYLVGEGWPFDVPRLDAPRVRVPAGAVGLAAGFTGAYPREAPGGWRLIGATAAPLFDPDAAEPVLLTPGTRVRFVGAPRAGALLCGSGSPSEFSSGPIAPSTIPAVPSAPVNTMNGSSSAPGPALRVDAAGHATVQDLGRPGLAHLGIARSGALDRGALRLANRLVGNAEDAAGIEIAPGGLAVTALRDVWAAVTGTWPTLTITRGDAAGPRPVDAYRAHLLRAGDRLEIGWPAHGARSYLSLRGGVATPVVLASRATDTLAGIGPDPLRIGDSIAAADAAAGPIPILDACPWGWLPDELVLPLSPGPRADWFGPDAHRALAAATWTVSTSADRVGVRLDGPQLARARHGELPSEGMLPGAIQVPPGGRPVILLADGPVTGGYPVIAVVPDHALDALAQAAPGTRIRFLPRP